MKTSLIRVTLLSLVVIAAAWTAASSADAAEDISKPEELVNASLATFNNFTADPQMTWFNANVGAAKAIVIYPRIIRAGFIFGGSGGSGVMLQRDEKSGAWSYPAFFTMGSGSFGFQAGVDVAQVILLVMTEKGMDALLSTNFKLGTDASVAAGPVGAGAKLQTADVMAISRTKGVFGGVSVEGAVIKPRDKWNSAYYGKEVRAVDIAVKRNVSNPAADPLRAAIAKASAK